MKNGPIKFNSNFYKEPEFWLAMFVMAFSGGTVLSWGMNDKYFWMDIILILLGIGVLVDSMVLFRKK